MARWLCAVFLTCALFGQTATSAAAGSKGIAETGINDPRLDERADALIRQMTLEEKIGQLVQYSAGQPTGPGTGRSDYEDMIAKGEIGSLLNVIETKQIAAYQKIAVEKSRLHIPILFGLDVIHGFRTEFPIPLGLASTWEPEIIEKASRVAALEASATGIRWTFSPMVDIARDARWGRIQEGAGEDPYLGSLMAAAYVRGYQGAQLDAPDSIAACAKHFVGYGAAEGGRDYSSTEISEHTLREYYLPPFRAAVDAGTATLMSAFNSLNGIPASANPFTLTEVLRKEWGFRGLVVSDWDSIGELVPHGVAIDNKAAAREGFLAGVDVDMTSSVYHDHLAELVRSGVVPEARIDESVRRVLRVKLALGLFEHPYVEEGRSERSFFLPESLELARTAAERSVVLLRNEAVGGSAVLPISKGVKKIAVIGPLADDPSDPAHTHPAPRPKSGGLSFPAVLAQRVGEGNILRFKGTGILDGSDAEIAAAVAGAKQADLAVLTLGEAPEMSGEAASRTRLGLPGRQEELLEAIVATGKPVALILFSGRPLTLPWAFSHVPAVLEAWFPGIEGGEALARVLFGDVNPTGKLVVSWPRSVDQEPLYYNELSTGRPPGNVDLTRPPFDTESKYVSRYIDEQNTPQFPFGYGLTYTRFTYGDTRVSAETLSAGELNKSLSANSRRKVVDVEAAVTDSGSRAADEIVQLYVRLQGTSTAQPVRALKGFQHVTLAPGETKTVKFEIGPDAFAFWTATNEYAVEPSKVTMWISPDSAHGKAATLNIVP
ncbi:MAG TPA: glycoside hydrolase family 3 N-terminal domain-containing protein [Terriglobales bacterium]|nr:glycoside hydrolase family 3 N-terminal domain-containing protein [Terriglobales bacterium]